MIQVKTLREMGFENFRLLNDGIQQPEDVYTKLEIGIVNEDGEKTYQKFTGDFDYDTFEALVNAKKKLQDCYIARQAEYPKIEDQLDQIYHEGIDAWKATIQAIKDQFPKP